MDAIKRIFLRKKAVLSALEPFGFRREGEGYSLTRALPESGFGMTVTVSDGGRVSAVVTDPELREPYTLHLADGATGRFVGGVRAEYEGLLEEIAGSCFEPEVFRSPQAKELIAYVRGRYGGELEFLWEKFPDNAVWRRSDSRKWYGALLTVSRRKLGLESAELAEAIDLRERPEAVEALVDGKTYFAGWHMNKRNWYTILLDGSVPTEEICERIDASFALASKERKPGR